MENQLLLASIAQSINELCHQSNYLLSGWVGRPKTDQLNLLQLLPICTGTMFLYWLVHMCTMMFNLVGFHTIRALEKSITLICLQKSSHFQLYFLCSLILLFTYLFMDKDYEETNPI